MNGHCNHLALKFSVCVKERQDRLPTMYWLPKLHKTPYKARFIANSSSCTTTELSKLLTSCLTAVKNHVIRYCEKVYERSGKNLFWSIKTSGEVLNKLKSRGFRATSLSTYDFSTLYTSLPHNLIKEKLINLIEWTFKREGSPYIASNERQAFFTSEDTKREYVEPDALKEWKVSIFKIVDQRIKFYSQNTNLLPPKPKSTFRHLKQGIQDFHRKYVLVPADKAANNVVVV